MAILYHIPPILNPPTVLKTSFGAKLPNLMTANISYCINQYGSLYSLSQAAGLPCVTSEFKGRDAHTVAVLCALLTGFHREERGTLGGGGEDIPGLPPPQMKS